ncbi:hypothetical protein ACFO9E_18130 [Streptomyces maoxianensis]|uniref:Uncharacterized protein n=1 Tax=Streptomyces maoxianensis TaxID=1459942 RepID=A0ABV9G6P7_9ACTN
MSRIAPLLAAWKRRYPNAGPAQTRATGDVNDGSPLMVEMLVDGLWENLTAQSLVLDRTKVRITGGQSSEGSLATAGMCTFAVKNHEELGYPFSQGNPLSPYWGKVGQGTRIRVSVPSGFDKSYRFQGELTALEEEADISGKGASVSMTAAGILERLGRGGEPLRSALYRDITRTDPAGRRTYPKAYWPMEDPSGSTSMANEADSTRPMGFTGSPSLATSSSFDCSDPIPNVSGAKFAGYVGAYRVDLTRPSCSTVWFLLSADSAITVGTLLVRVVTAQHRWELVYISVGNIRLRIYDYNANVLYDSGPLAVGIVGTPRWFGLGMFDDGTRIEPALWSQDVATDTLDFLLTDSLAGERGSAIRYVQINPNATATDFRVGHVAVFFHRQDDTNNSTNGYFPSNFVLDAFNGERADTRFDRLCREEQITHEVQPQVTPHALPGLWVGIGQRMGPQKPGALLALLRQCEATDGGIIYEMTSDFGLGYRTLESMTSQAAAVTLSQGNNELSEQPQPRRDSGRFKNSVTASRIDGSSATVTDDAHILAVGRYPDGISLSLQSDTQLRDQAGWAVHLGTVTEPRYERLAVNLAHPAFTGGTLRQNVLAVRPGDRVDVGDVSARLGYDDIVQLALGYTEEIDHFQHKITWNTGPEAPYRVLVIGQDGYDRIDAGDSHLEADVDGTTTTLSVNSLDGTRWIDSASYSDRFPFDIAINRERMTVTAITGTTSPQTFTVTRSVNGIIRGHPAGSDVRLFSPVYLGL